MYGVAHIGCGIYGGKVSLMHESSLSKKGSYPMYPPSLYGALVIDIGPCQHFLQAVSLRFIPPKSDLMPDQTYLLFPFTKEMQI